MPKHNLPSRIGQQSKKCVHWGFVFGSEVPFTSKSMEVVIVNHASHLRLCLRAVKSSFYPQRLLTKTFVNKIAAKC